MPKLMLLLLVLEPGSAAQRHVGAQRTRSHSMSSSRWIRWLGGPWRGDGEEAKAVIAHVGTEREDLVVNWRLWDGDFFCLMRAPAQQVVGERGLKKYDLSGVIVR